MAILLLQAAIATPAYDQPQLIGLAKAAVRAEVLGCASPSIEKRTPPQAVFVTIERKGRILGCRGSLDLTSDSLEGAVIDAARNAATHDPRYKPITRSQLKAGFQVTITIVQRLEPLDDVGGLQPSEGLILTSGDHTGVVLPWEGKDPKIRLTWAYKKAGVSEGSAVRLRKLLAVRFKG